MSAKKLSPVRIANLDAMAEELYRRGGSAHGQDINEAIGICSDGQRSAAGDRLYLDAKEDGRFEKPAAERGKKATWKLTSSGKAQLTRARAAAIKARAEKAAA